MGADHWYDDVVVVNSKQRAIASLNSALNQLEERKVLARVPVLVDVPVSAGAGFVALSVAAAQAPGNAMFVALSGSSDGAICAQSPFSGAGFLSAELTEVAGANAVDPKNLVLIRDATTGEPLTSAGRDVFGLLQVIAGAADGVAFTDSGNKAKLSFVRLTSGLDDLESCTIPTGVTAINYSFVRRLRLDDMPEEFWLNGHSFTDHTTQVDVTLQRAYTNQGGATVALATDAVIKLAASGSWTIKNDAASNRFRVTDSGVDVTGALTVSGATTVAGAATLSGSLAVTGAASFASTLGVTGTATVAGNTTIGGSAVVGGNLTVSAQAITAATGDLSVSASAGELALDDSYNNGTIAGGARLSDAAGEWTNYVAEFGQVSLLAALTRAKDASTTTRAYAIVLSEVAANVNIGGVAGGANLDGQLPSMAAGTFTREYDVYLNGNFLRPGADAGTDNDYYPGSSLANGQLKFEFALKTNDVICVVSRVSQ